VQIMMGADTFLDVAVKISSRIDIIARDMYMIPICSTQRLFILVDLLLLADQQ